MKKVVILILVIGLIAGGYIFLTRQNIHESRCEDGFRFNPATNSCESAQADNKEGIDFTSLKIKTISGNQISLIQEGESTKYTGQSKGDAGATDIEYVSLDTKEAIDYDEDIFVLPYVYNAGGTGQFVYVGIFNKKTNEHEDSIVLGDRISIQSIQVAKEKVKVNFKDRLLAQSFAETPTIPTQFVFEIKDNKIIPIMQLQNADYSDVELKYPTPGAIIEDTLTVKGAVPGSWYFEANAHFKILSEMYQEIAIGNIQALSDWTTTQKVPFELSVPVESLNYTGPATVIIESENVRGDEEGEKNVKRMFIPITIK